jgi:hypothetical protein
VRVAILGCGPAGLMAAHAANIAGATRVFIHSKRRKSQMYGAQYLHSPIPGMTDVAPVTVKYHLRGSIEDYRFKVYGHTWEGDVSPEDYIGEHDAWNIRRTYDNLWERYGDMTLNTQISPGWMENFMDYEGKALDVVICSIPKSAICKMGHNFRSQHIWAMGDAPEGGQFVNDVVLVPNNTVICDGSKTTPYYRASRVFGYATVEWPFGVGPVDGASLVEKPLDNNCDCWPGVTFVGRYGTWQKDVLSHTAYQDVLDMLTVEAK